MSTPTPEINVNLKPCTCGYVNDSRTPEGHLDTCPGAPVAVLLSLEPHRLFTCTVALGECDCSWRTLFAVAPGAALTGADHDERCATRPVRVTCSISDKTWPETEVSDAIDAERNTDIGWSAEEKNRILAACRDRWEIVKALVTGANCRDDANTGLLDLFIQRDAVYAALTDMARTEEAHNDAKQRAFKAAGMKPRPSHATGDAEEVLRDFIGDMIEQVGDLTT